MNILISRKIEIDMGHRVPFHKGQCRNLHGHRYVIEAAVEGPVHESNQQSDGGMVLDYGDLKQIMMEEIHEPLDHGFMMYDGDPLKATFKTFEDQKIVFVAFIPTAENIAYYLYQKLEQRLQSLGLDLKTVKIWETPNSTAIYPAS